MGDALLSCSLSLDFFTIADLHGNILPQTSPMYRTYLRGDAKQGGAITIADALFIAQYLAKLRPLSDLNAVNAASVRYDGDTGDKVNTSDALFMAQYKAMLRDTGFKSK